MPLAVRLLVAADDYGAAIGDRARAWVARDRMVDEQIVAWVSRPCVLAGRCGRCRVSNRPREPGAPTPTIDSPLRSAKDRRSPSPYVAVDDRSDPVDGPRARPGSRHGIGLRGGSSSPDSSVRSTRSSVEGPGGVGQSAPTARSGATRTSMSVMATARAAGRPCALYDGISDRRRPGLPTVAPARRLAVGGPTGDAVGPSPRWQRLRPSHRNRSEQLTTATPWGRSPSCPYRRRGLGESGGGSVNGCARLLSVEAWGIVRSRSAAWSRGAQGHRPSGHDLRLARRGHRGEPEPHVPAAASAGRALQHRQGIADRRAMSQALRHRRGGAADRVHRRRPRHVQVGGPASCPWRRRLRPPSTVGSPTTCRTSPATLRIRIALAPGSAELTGIFALASNTSLQPRPPGRWVRRR